MEQFASENLRQRLRELMRWTHTGESAGVFEETVALLAKAGAVMLVYTSITRH